MKKVSVIYWSNLGNVSILADSVAKGAKDAGAEVVIKHVSEATKEDVLNADGVAFGSPSLDGNKIEQKELAPFIKDVRDFNVGDIPVVLFGSYGWDEGKFMEDWKAQMEEDKFKVIGSLAVKETPSDEELNLAAELGAKLVK
ncbi:MAG: flavodoxin domain-containing protein [Clostridiaceae bacterium]